MDGGYSDGLRRFAPYSSPLVSTKGNIGKLLMRMQSAEADCNEMYGGCSGSFRQFARYSSLLVSTKGILVNCL